MALLEDLEDGLLAYGGFIRALRRAMVNRCKAGFNCRQGIVWRGMQIDDNSAYQVGQKFLWPNFVSTTWSVDSCFTANTTFRIDLDGVGVTYAVDISNDSQFPKEQEVLIYP